jgi:tRNA(fMet)-specific endonuclease VapC
MVFLDINVVVDLMHARKPKLIERFIAQQTAGAPLAISTIVVFELRYGAENNDRPEQNLRVLEAAIDGALTVHPFDADAAADAARIRAELRRAGEMIGPFEILIAAHARSRGALLVTGNVRGLARVKGLVLTDWAA